MWGVSYFRLNVPCQMDWKRERRKNETFALLYIYLRNIYKAPYRAAVPSLFLFARTDTVIQTESVRPAVDIIFPFVYIVVVDIYTHTESFNGQNIQEKEEQQRLYFVFQQERSITSHGALNVELRDTSSHSISSSSFSFFSYSLCRWTVTARHHRHSIVYIWRIAHTLTVYRGERIERCHTIGLVSVLSVSVGSIIYSAVTRISKVAALELFGYIPSKRRTKYTLFIFFLNKILRIYHICRITSSRNVMIEMF